MSDYYNQLDSTRYSESDIYGEDYMKVTRYMDSNGVFMGNVYTDKLVVGEAKITSALIESIEADQINANELSAISANLGTITAGHITGVTHFSNTVNDGILYARKAEDFAKVFRDSFGIDCEAGDLFGTRKVRGDEYKAVKLKVKKV